MKPKTKKQVGFPNFSSVATRKHHLVGGQQLRNITRKRWSIYN